MLKGLRFASDLQTGRRGLGRQRAAAAELELPRFPTRPGPAPPSPPSPPSPPLKAVDVGIAAAATATVQRGGSAWVLVANAAVLLFAESTRGLVLSSLFAFLSAAAPGCGLSATALLGAAVAAFSAGRLAASFLFGWVSERGFPYSALLQLSLLATLAGQLLYIAGDALPQGPLATSAIVFARTVVGFGSGILPTCRAVVVECSSVERRMRGLAQLSFFKYVGYAITPGLGAVLVGNVHIVGPLRFNSFTMPAWLSVVLCVVGIAMVRATFDPAFHSGKEMGKAPAPTPMEGDDVAPLVVASPLSLRFWMSLHGPLCS